MLHCGCLGVQSSWFLHLHGCFVAPNEGWMWRMPEDTTATLVFSLWRWSFKRLRQLLKKIYESFCGTCYRQLRLRSSCCHLVVGPLFMAFIPHVLTITNPINSSHCLRWCIWRETSHNYQPNTLSLWGIMIPLLWKWTHVAWLPVLPLRRYIAVCTVWRIQSSLILRFVAMDLI